MLPFDPLTKTNIFHSDLVTRHLAANISLVGFATILVVLRFITRRICRTKIWWDDFAAVVSLIFTIGMLAMHITDANYGMGYQTKELPIANSIFLAKLLIAYQAVYYAAVSSVKLSYLLFYLRFFTLKEHRIWVWICMGLVVAYWLGSMLATFLLCTPLEANWNPLLAKKYCPDHKHSTAFVATGIFNMITDLIIILLPIPFIRKLQMTRGAKIGLVAIFAIGLLYETLGVACSVYVS
ncbi:uncharacterized protein J4E84_008934 [Alternaria hordeiaustralica]|uniref:uncharacterized protein n=1 Tax=Alternaria hordeiaustralica TaxID=1187925 RepID=UPI0020C1F968|nr:uncharacterized protein J4E84_008934 [Alternaria hordeiaustralica]KAI4677987.1 hypothetical protein J4E84_008934 [Alternaria hordeiaustralica]